MVKTPEELHLSEENKKIKVELPQPASDIGKKEAGESEKPKIEAQPKIEPIPEPHPVREVVPATPAASPNLEVLQMELEHGTMADFSRAAQAASVPPGEVQPEQLIEKVDIFKTNKDKPDDEDLPQAA